MIKKKTVPLLLFLVVFLAFFLLKTLVFLEVFESTSITRGVEYFCFSLFILLFYYLSIDYIKSSRENKKISSYTKKLNEVLILQNSNHIFYTGDVSDGSRILTKEVSESISADRCSIWLFNDDKTSIACNKLYVRSEDKWYENDDQSRKDFESYFNDIEVNTVIIANDAVNLQSTSCFEEKYLIPLCVKSMFNTPVLYKGEIIGIICIESYIFRKWIETEINFVRLISSLYTFSYSVQQTNRLYNDVQKYQKELSNRMEAINKSNAVIEFDSDKKIIYANDIFLNLMGYEEKEVIGNYHSIFLHDGHENSKEYLDFWEILKNGTFISKECIRKKKNGDSIWLQATYNPIKDINGKTYRIMKIATDITEFIQNIKEIEKKNTYLEHAAKILRHDMHSGINTYIPRGLSSLERRLSNEDIEKLKIEAPIRMIKEGLKHAQKVYKGVYEFTNLVKKDVVLNRSIINVKTILKEYLASTAYGSQVILDDSLPDLNVNESLFCTAIDNLIRNGLKYNDSSTKFVKIYSDGDYIYVLDNGRGMSQEDFEKFSQPYMRKGDQKESGTGLGLNICVAILKEHGFSMYCEKKNIGTKIKIKIYND
jgi:PAS domain S-box-containing protein